MFSATTTIGTLPLLSINKAINHRHETRCLFEGWIFFGSAVLLTSFVLLVANSGRWGPYNGEFLFHVHMRRTCKSNDFLYKQKRRLRGDTTTAVLSPDEQKTRKTIVPFWSWLDVVFTGIQTTTSY